MTIMRRNWSVSFYLSSWRNALICFETLFQPENTSQETGRVLLVVFFRRIKWGCVHNLGGDWRHRDNIKYATFRKLFFK